MIGVNLKKWDHSSGSVVTRTRYYYKGKWTPFVKIKLRYFKLNN